ncbi:PAS domain S-box protein [Candidatus Poribacteria bacterium]|nr:PAS domain S-box protein [Candidatus Poribacteria bacterium]
MPYHRLQSELQKANQELETAYEELQSTNEELETTNEELQSTIEELETTNEELQSTNEELETMNEELQSTTMELQTINDELHQRTDELNSLNAFQKSIFAGLRSGVVVVDPAFKISIWNEKSEDLWGLRADEVQGQSFFYLDIGLPIEPLTELIRAVLARESNYQEISLDATNRRGKTIRCRIVGTPLIGVVGEIEGVILLMDELAPQQIALSSVES